MDLGLVQVVIAADEAKIPAPESAETINLYILTNSYSAPTAWTLKGKLSDDSLVAIAEV